MTKLFDNLHNPDGTIRKLTEDEVEAIHAEEGELMSAPIRRLDGQPWKVGDDLIAVSTVRGSKVSAVVEDSAGNVIGNSDV
jgi:hypothetical protein